MDLLSSIESRFEVNLRPRSCSESVQEHLEQPEALIEALKRSTFQ